MRINNENRIVEVTADGSTTIYLPDMDEHYHSVKGALTESNHIFRDSALLHHPADKVRVLEIGFGTGLNAAVSATVGGVKSIDYQSLELYPLTRNEIDALGYSSLFDVDDAGIYNKIIDAPWGEQLALNHHV